jgi:hypothetical protein
MVDHSDTPCGRTLSDGGDALKVLGVELWSWRLTCDEVSAHGIIVYPVSPYKIGLFMLYCHPSSFTLLLPILVITCFK